MGKLGPAMVMPRTSTYAQDVMYRALARKEATLPVKELDCTVTTLKPCAYTAPPTAVEKQIPSHTSRCRAKESYVRAWG